KECDWNVYVTKFVDTQLSDMMNSRKLARLTCLRACYSFQQKEGLAAIADLTAVVKMGRHLCKKGPFIATLVQLAIENSAIDVAAAYLPQQNAETLKAVARSLEALPKAPPLGEAIQGEKDFLLQYIRPQYQGKSSKEAF